MAAFARKLASSHTRSLRGALSVPARYHLGTVDNSYAGESSVRDRGQPAGMDAFVPTRLCRAAPDLSTLLLLCLHFPNHVRAGLLMRRFHGDRSWNLRSTCSRNPRLREPSATEQAVTFCCYAKQPGIERCCAHHTCLAASVRIVTCKCAASRFLASVKPRREHIIVPLCEHVLCGMEDGYRRSNKDGSCSKSRGFTRSYILCVRDTLGNVK